MICVCPAGFRLRSAAEQLALGAESQARRSSERAGGETPLWGDLVSIIPENPPPPASPRKGQPGQIANEAQSGGHMTRRLLGRSLVK